MWVCGGGWDWTMAVRACDRESGVGAASELAVRSHLPCCGSYKACLSFYWKVETAVVWASTASLFQVSDEVRGTWYLGAVPMLQLLGLITNGFCTVKEIYMAVERERGGVQNHGWERPGRPGFLMTCAPASIYRAMPVLRSKVSPHMDPLPDLGLGWDPGILYSPFPSKPLGIRLPCDDAENCLPDLTDYTEGRGGEGKMRALGWWLMLVGSLRLASVWFGFFDIWALRLAVFSKSPSELAYLPLSIKFVHPFSLFSIQLSLILFLFFSFLRYSFPIHCKLSYWNWFILLKVAHFNDFVVTEVHGRTFGVWTLLTCTLCFLCAFNLDNKQLYLATFLSFIYALGHFLTEYLIYQTMAITNLTTVSIFAGMCVSHIMLHHFRPHLIFSFLLLRLMCFLDLLFPILLCTLKMTTPIFQTIKAFYSYSGTSIVWMLLQWNAHQRQQVNLKHS
ncbi:Ergosterol biosynthetic protein 28 [Vitis vinifera]|uniref:Ergosterol biosynthetic protein 28 n=1 Tax=Vitis vinifera TaxID=29760 RepID=A0A438KMS2_VITVI|nr:Ergosterol biosynthetic protein 28 [Vitis vinifera]